MKYCEWCIKSFDDDYYHCPYCGHKVYAENDWVIEDEHEICKW